ncbi:hypothetical protein BVX99_00885 [bacterium F16]|nr:hypothetical protein BVX99_00885 [bacterium F16]
MAFFELKDNYSSNSMDNNNIIRVVDWSPVVRVANHHEFRQRSPWQRVNPDPQLIVCIHGALAFGYHDPQGVPIMRITAGEVLFIRPELKHTIGSVEEDTVISGFHFEPVAGSRFRDVSDRLDPVPNTRTVLGDEFAAIKALFVELAETYQGHRKYQDHCLQTLCHHILLRLAGYWGTGTREYRVDRRVEEMLEYIQKNYRDAISRQTLGVRFGMTPEHVNYLFKTKLNTTPTSVINRERCLRAYELLNREGLSVKEAAYDVGFGDPAYFSRVFRAVMHQSPNDVKPG